MDSIEKLISQKKFKDEYQKGLISLMYAVNQINDKSAVFFKEFQLTRQQYNVLRILRGQFPNPITIANIKSRMIDKNSDVSRIVGRLLKAQLVSILPSAKDKRATDIIISNVGLRLLNKVDEDVNDMHEPLKALNQSEIIQFNAYLNKIINNI